MSINKDNSNNKGGGKVDNFKKEVIKRKNASNWAVDYYGKTRGVYGDEQELSRSINKGWGKQQNLPKVFPNRPQVQQILSTTYPQLIHRQSGGRSGE